MKTQPDEITLTLWMDGELEGDELARVEAWAQDHAELLAERDAVRSMRASIKKSVPGSIEPPYSDFFNQRILRGIEAEAVLAEPEVSRHEAGGGFRFWQWFAVPAAAAVMVACFYLGTRVGDAPSSSMQQVGVVPVIPTVYTPDVDVKADMFDAGKAGAMVIVLEGLEDIPDELDVVGGPLSRRSGAVAVSTGLTF